MNCRALENDLKDLAAETLPQRREAALRAHLEVCAACRQALTAERAVYDSLDAALHNQVNAEVPAHLGLQIRIAGEAERNNARSTWRPIFTVLAPAAAAAALLFLVARVHWLNGSAGPSQTPATPPVIAAQTRPSEPLPRPPESPRSARPRARASVRSANFVKPTGTTLEVLVSRGEEEEMVKYIETLRRHENQMNVVVVPGNTRLEIAPLEVARLEMKPLDETQESNQKD